MNEEDYDKQYSEGQLMMELGQDEDINGLEAEENYNQNEAQVRDDILFAIQGFGSVQRIKKGDMLIDAYIKGKHCEASLKDICKLLKNDNPDSPLAKIILCSYNIIETDLIQLLLSQVDDKKLSFWLIAVMALLTIAPTEQIKTQERYILLASQRAYKKSFLRKECMNTLLVHFAEYLQTPHDKRKNAHEQLVEFIIILIRNLVQIPNDPQQYPHLHEHFLVCMMKEDMFESLLYLIQSNQPKLLKKVDMLILEIVFHTFTCFEPKTVYELKQTPDPVRQSVGKTHTPSRSTRFMPNFQYRSSHGVTKVLHKITDPKTVDLLSNKQQRNKPVHRAKAAKVKSIKHTYVQQNLLIPLLDSNDTATVKQKMQGYCKQFLDQHFTRFQQLIFDCIYKEEPRMQQKHKIYYFIICQWALMMTRQKFKQTSHFTSKQEKCQVEFDLAAIAQLMQIPHFQLIYKTLYHEVTREKKKDFKVNSFNGALLLFKQYIAILEDMSLSYNANDRKNSNILMQNMFRHDIAKVLKEGFYLAGNEEVIENLILTCHSFFKLLNDFSRGKVLTIQTNRLVKKKKKTKKEKLQQMEDKEIDDFIEKDESDSDGGEYGKDEDPAEKDKRKKEKKEHAKELQEDDEEDDNPVYQQRKYNEQSQFSVLAEYGIIQKYLTFLRYKKFKSNLPHLNAAIFSYFDKIVNLLKAEWLLYQGDTLTIFSQMLSDDQFMVSQKITQLKSNKNVRFLNQVAHGFVDLFSRNRLALPEMLFRCSSLALKDSILNNYEHY